MIAALLASVACDFCMLGQGVSPYMTANGHGVTISSDYTESDRVYDGTKQAPGPNGKKEGWLIESLTGFASVGEDFTVLLTLPYAIKTNIDYEPETQETPGVLVDGLGDVTLSARYTALSHHTLTSTLKLGVLAGVKLPTGKTDETDLAGQPVDRHALPGTGSVDWLLGVESAAAFGGAYLVTADVVYDKAGEGKWHGDKHRYGDAWNYAVEGYFKVWPPETTGTSSFVMTGLSGENTGKETGVRTEDGYAPDQKNLSSGGTVLYWDFGLHATFEAATILDVGYSKAVYHRMNFSPDFDADPAESYKLRLAVTRLL